MTQKENKVGLVLSGGGARGAYEVGIIMGIVEVLQLKPSSPCPFQVITGTSVGAANAAHLVSNAHHGDMALDSLVDAWGDLKVSRDVRLDLARFFGVKNFVPRLFDRFRPGDGERTGYAATSLLDPKPIDNMIRQKVNWEKLHQNINEGIIEAFIVSALQLSSGRTTMFVESSPQSSFTPTRDPRRIAHFGPLDAEHLLASGAIPFVFPPRMIDGRYYCDGGLRFNTPISPAIRAGANRLVIITLGREKISRLPPAPEDYPSPFLLVGKVLNALLLDPTRRDLQVLERTNRLLTVLENSLEPHEKARFDATLTETRGAPYQVLETLSFAPSQDIGAIAGSHLRSHMRKWDLSRMSEWLFGRAARAQASWEADLASYLLFDGTFADALIQLGRVDALERATEIRNFFQS